MGQRLNIEIVKDNKVLANSYYHWSGFSNCAINLAKEIIQNYEYIKKYKVEPYIKDKDLLFAIRLLETTGAGVCSIKSTRDFLEDKTQNLKIQECEGRNEGIISITAPDIEDTRNWEEGRVTIDIADETIDFDVIWEETPEEFKSNYTEEEFKKLNIENINRKFKKIPFEDVFELKAFIDKAIYKKELHFYNEKDNKYVTLIQ